VQATATPRMARRQALAAKPSRAPQSAKAPFRAKLVSMTDRRPKVLVVDDNTALRENLGEALEDEGYAVVLAPDGARALAALEVGSLPDIVLVDLVMPGMDGRELVTRIRADGRWAGVRLVLTSGLSRPEVGEAAVDAFLPKPFGLELLLETLQTVRRD
jgi:CheY-like chemotaxis protein